MNEDVVDVVTWGRWQGPTEDLVARMNSHYAPIGHRAYQQHGRGAVCVRVAKSGHARATYRLKDTMPPSVPRVYAQCYKPEKETVVLYLFAGEPRTVHVVIVPLNEEQER